MIYLIGGAPKCGKTTLSKNFSRKTGFSYLSVDTLQNIIKPYISKNKLEEKFPSTFQNCNKNDEKYSKYSIKEIVDAYIKQGETSYNAIDMLIICQITSGIDFILEGYQITPFLVKKLKEKYPNNIKSVFLAKTDKISFLNNIEKSKTYNDWIISKTENKKETYSKIADMVCYYSKIFKKESKKYGLKIIDMDYDFEDNLIKTIKYLEN